MLNLNKKILERLTKPFWTRFWGQRRKSHPVFITKALGDGMKLLAVTPINTRPNYYLIRVDSSWSDSNRDTPCVGEHMDEIYDAIEDQCGRGYEDKYESVTGRERHNPWPALSADSGSSWCESADLLQKESHD